MKIKIILFLFFILPLFGLNVFGVPGHQDLKPRRLAMYFDFSKSELPEVKDSKDSIVKSFATNIYQKASVCIVDENILLKFLYSKKAGVSSFETFEDTPFDLSQWSIYYVPKTLLYVFIPKEKDGQIYNMKEVENEDVFKQNSWEKINAANRKDLYPQVCEKIGTREKIDFKKSDFFTVLGAIKSRPDQYDLSTIFVTSKDLYAKKSPLLEKYKTEMGEDFKGVNVLKKFFRPWNVVIDGHGAPDYQTITKTKDGSSVSASIGALGGIPIEVFTGIVKLLDSLNTQFLLVISCSAGGKNVEHAVRWHENIFSEKIKKGWDEIQAKLDDANKKGPAAQAKVKKLYGKSQLDVTGFTAAFSLNLTYPVVFASITDAITTSAYSPELTDEINQTTNIDKFFSVLEDKSEPMQRLLRKELPDGVIALLDQAILKEINDIILKNGYNLVETKDSGIKNLVDYLTLNIKNLLQKKLLSAATDYIDQVAISPKNTSYWGFLMEKLKENCLDIVISKEESSLLFVKVNQLIKLPKPQRNYKEILDIYLQKKHDVLKVKIKDWLNIGNDLPFYPALRYLTLSEDWFFKANGLNSIPQILLPKVGWFNPLTIDSRILILRKALAQKLLYENESLVIKDKYVIVISPDILNPSLKISPVQDKRADWIDSLPIKNLWDLKKNAGVSSYKDNYYYYPKIVSHGSSDFSFFKEMKINTVKIDDEVVSGLCHFLRDAFLSMQGRTIKKFFYIKKLIGSNDFHVIYDYKKMFDISGSVDKAWFDEIKKHEISELLEFTDVYIAVKEGATTAKIIFKWKGKVWENSDLIDKCLVFKPMKALSIKDAIDDPIGKAGYEKFEEIVQVDSLPKKFPKPSEKVKPDPSDTPKPEEQNIQLKGLHDSLKKLKDSMAGLKVKLGVFLGLLQKLQGKLVGLKK